MLISICQCFPVKFACLQVCLHSSCTLLILLIVVPTTREITTVYTGPDTTTVKTTTTSATAQSTTSTPRITELPPPAYCQRKAEACWLSGFTNLVMDCRDTSGYIDLLMQEDLSYFAQRNTDVNTKCEEMVDSCYAPLTSTNNHLVQLQEKCQDEKSCTVQMVENFEVQCTNGQFYMDMEYVSYACQPGCK